MKKIILKSEKIFFGIFSKSENVQWKIKKFNVKSKNSLKNRLFGISGKTKNLLFEKLKIKLYSKLNCIIK